MTVTRANGLEQAAAPFGPQARVFVGLKIVPEIAIQLVQLTAALQRPAVRPVAPADIHVTLVPPWNEASTPDAIERLGLVACRFHTFTLIIQHVGYGPQPRQPRLLWADCAASGEITALRAALMQACGQTDERAFQPHVTLARIRGDGRAIARNHPIDQQLSLTQRIESVELFQSPPPGENGYRVLASLPLGEAASSALDP
jgi:2'-5' RNA ligase